MDELNEIDDSLAFTTDDELELLRGSSLAIMLATIRFLQEKRIDLAEWTSALSREFAKGWDTSETWSADEFIDAVLLNLQAFGADAPVAEYEDESANARVELFPDYDRVDGMGLADVPGDVLFDLFGEVARVCGIQWSWRRDGDAVLIEARTGSA